MNGFFLKENVPEKLECVLDLSILERVALLLERCFFLKKAITFLERVLRRFFMDIFHWDNVKT